MEGCLLFRRVACLAWVAPKVKYNGVRLQFQSNILLLPRCVTYTGFGNSPGSSKPVLSPVWAAVTQRAGMAHWHNQKMPQISSGFSFPTELGLSSEMPETKKSNFFLLFLWDRDGSSTEWHCAIGTPLKSAQRDSRQKVLLLHLVAAHLNSKILCTAWFQVVGMRVPKVTLVLSLVLGGVVAQLEREVLYLMK